MDYSENEQTAGKLLEIAQSVIQPVFDKDMQVLSPTPSRSP